MEKLQKGKVLFEQQEYYDAIIELNEFLENNANNADALYVRALCYRKTVDYEKSIVDFTAILQRLPDEATLLCDRGISYFENKNIELALQDMDKAVELEPQNPYRYSSRAYIRANVDIEGAIADYEKAIELDPRDEISLNNLGLLQENKGKMKAAKHNFKKADAISGYSVKKQDSIKPGEKIHNNETSLTKMMLSVFTSKKTRQEYFKFLFAIFRKGD